MATALALAPGGRSVALALKGTSTERDAGRVRVFDLARRGSSFDCAGAPGDCAGLVFDAGGTRLIAGTSDGRLCAFDARDGHALEELALPHKLVALERSNDGRRVLALSGDGRATLCTLEPLAAGTAFTGLAAGAGRVRFARDERTLVGAAAGGANRLARWDAASGRLLGEIELPAALASFECSPDARDPSILCGLQDGRLLLVAGDGTPRTLLRAEAGWPVDFLSWSPDARHVLACAGRNESGGAWLVDLGGAAPIALADARQRRVYRAAFAPDGRHVATASFDQRVCVWNVATARAERVMRGRFRAQELCWTDDGTRILMRNVGTGALVWIAAELPDVYQLDAPPGAASALAVTSDGTRALGICSDGEARLWQLADGIGTSGTCLRRWSGAGSGGFRALALAPDGHGAVLAGADGSLLRIDLDRDGEPVPIAAPLAAAARSLAFDATGELLLVLGSELCVLDAAHGWRAACTPLVPAPSCAALLPQRAGVVCGFADGRVCSLPLADAASGPRWERA